MHSVLREPEPMALPPDRAVAEAASEDLG